MPSNKSPRLAHKARGHEAKELVRDVVTSTSKTDTAATINSPRTAHDASTDLQSKRVVVLRTHQVSRGRISGNEIIVEGTFNDQTKRYTVLEDRGRFLRLTDGRTDGWVFASLVENASQKRKAGDRKSDDVPLRRVQVRKSQPVRGKVTRTRSPFETFAPSVNHNGNRRSEGERAERAQFMTHWINHNSRKRHNRSCQWYGNTKTGQGCGPNEGIACKKCGG